MCCDGIQTPATPAHDSHFETDVDIRQLQKTSERVSISIGLKEYSRFERRINFVDLL